MAAGDGVAPGVLDRRLPLDELHRTGGIALLDDEERARAARLKRPEARRRFVAAHVALRTVLGRHLGCEPGEVVLVRRPCLHCGGPHGKPVVAGADVSFSLSHSGPFAVVAVAAAGAEVGVDVEGIRRVDAARLARSRFAAEEREAVAAAGEDDRLRLFFRLWTRKEAVLKGTGEGLPGGLSTVPVLGGTVERAGRTWTVEDLPLGPGRIGALAVATPAGPRDGGS